MSLIHSPSIVTSGLIMYVDANNTRKCFKGKPTTNLDPYANAFSSWGAAGGITSIVDNAIAGPFGVSGAVVTANGSTNSYMYSSVTITTGNTYTRSVFAKAGTTSTLVFEIYDNNGSGGTGYSNVIFDLSSGTIVNNSDPTNSIASIEAYRDGWYRCIVTRAYTLTTSAGTLYIGAYGAGTGTLALYGNQVELGSFATPYVNGTRSNTEVLYDLTNSRTLTATSLTYASNNTFSFDGTNDYVACGTNPLTGTAAFTLSAWLKTTTVSKYTGAISIGLGGGTCAYLGTVDAAQQGTAQSLGGGFYGENHGTGVNALNTWSNLVFTYAGGAFGACIYYVNAQSKLNVNYGSTPNLNSSSIQIGKISTDTSYNFSGTIGVVQIYNRAISAAEVTQNFNTHRARYQV